jgi:hypothetical protein
MKFTSRNLIVVVLAEIKAVNKRATASWTVALTFRDSGSRHQSQLHVAVEGQSANDHGVVAVTSHEVRD